MKKISNEEIAFRIVSIYFEEIARLGFKRSLDLDSIINAYFFTLEKIKNKDAKISEMMQKVLEEEKKLLLQQKNEIIPMPEKQKEQSMQEKSIQENSLPAK